MKDKIISRYIGESPKISMKSEVYVCIIIRDTRKIQNKYPTYEDWLELQIKDVTSSFFQQLMDKYENLTKVKIFLKNNERINSSYDRQGLKRKTKTDRSILLLSTFNHFIHIEKDKKIKALKRHFNLYKSEKVYLIEYESYIKIGRSFQDNYLSRLFYSASYYKNKSSGVIKNCYLLKTDILRKEIKDKSRNSVELYLKRKYKDYKLYIKSSNSELLNKLCYNKILYDLKLLSHKNPYFEELIKFSEEEIKQLNDYKPKVLTWFNNY